MGSEQERRSDFDLYYSERLSQAACRLEKAALGHGVGIGGYTTVAQAQALVDQLQVDAQALLLDLGAGRGWPGIHIARAAGCHLIALDIPFDAMQVALANMQPVPPGRTCAAVVADGRALPLLPATVDSIVHADVF